MYHDYERLQDFLIEDAILYIENGNENRANGNNEAAATNYKQAAFNCKRAISSDGENNYDAHRFLGYACIGLGEYEKAEEALKKAESLNCFPKAEICNNLAYIYIQTNREEEAIPYLEQAIELAKEEGRYDSAAKNQKRLEECQKQIDAKKNLQPEEPTAG